MEMQGFTMHRLHGLGLSASTAEPVGRHPRGDARQPAGELGGLAQRSQLLIGFAEHLLAQVVNIVRSTDGFDQHSPHQGAVAFDQVAERMGVAGKGLLNQDAVFFRHNSSGVRECIAKRDKP